MTAWKEVPTDRSRAPGPRSRLAIFFRTATPGAVIACLLAVAGRATAATVILLVSMLVGLAASRSQRFRRGLDRFIHAVGTTVGRVLTVALLGLVELLVLAPLSLLSWVFRRDPLGGFASTNGAWGPHPSGGDHPTDRHQYALETRAAPSRVRHVVGLMPRAIGAFALVLALDLGIGSVLQNTVDTQNRVTAPVEARIAAATRDAPWFPAYRRELATLHYEFAPFVLTRVDDVSGRYINIDQGVRRSYEPQEASADLPLVWFFGGTNIWGEGQRDEHTIPSEIARLAEDAGTPIRVVNFGQRGDVNFAEALRFEQALAGSAEQPDLVVFGDGPDDYAVQLETPSDDPGQYGLTQAQHAVTNDHRSLWDRYADISVLHRIGARLQGLFSVQPAWGADGSGDSDQVATDLVSVYDRGRSLAGNVAADRNLPVRYFWLPIEARMDDSSAYSAATEALDPSVIDVSDALDDPVDPVYLDGVQTNELGAHLVATAMYNELRPDLEQLAD